jgi:cytochrome c oxidase subunit 4
MSSETREIEHDQHAHPVHGTRTYWVIGGVLFVLTAIEILLYYMEDHWHVIGGGTAAASIILVSALKFILVVMFYMHLKYDSRVFSGVFLFPFALGTLVIGSLWLLYHVLPDNRIIQ